MKKFKKMFLILTALALCLVPTFSSSITADAAEPKTYYIKYVRDMNEWRFQVGSWDDGVKHNDIGLIALDIKDGDMVVIEGNSTISFKTDVRLSNLTIAQTALAIVHANGIDNCYVLNDSTCAINGDVTNAYVYDKSTSNFNNNVKNLEVISSKEDHLKATVAVVGTVEHLKAYTTKQTHFEFYNFQADSLRITDGALKTEKSNFNEDPVAATPAPEPSTPATPSTPSAPSADEYDEVPKTADIRFHPLWLMILAAACMTGSYALKKSSK